MYNWLFASIFLSHLFLTGCATLFGDKDRNVRVESDPSGATVYLNGVPLGKTPTIIQVQDTTRPNFVTLKLDGYEELGRPINARIQGVAFLNLFNLVCWGVDFLSGNIYAIDSKMLHFELVKAKKSSALDHRKNLVYEIKSMTPQCPSGLIRTAG